MSRCTATTRDGTPCPNPAAADSPFCGFHGPEAAEGRRRGGRNSHGGGSPLSLVPPTAADLELATEEDVCRVAALLLNETRRGQLAPKVATACGFLIRLWLEAKRGDDLEQRFKDLAARNEELERRLATATGRRHVS